MGGMGGGMGPGMGPGMGGGAPGGAPAAAPPGPGAGGMEALLNAYVYMPVICYPLNWCSLTLYLQKTKYCHYNWELQ